MPVRFDSRLIIRPDLVIERRALGKLDRPLVLPPTDGVRPPYLVVATRLQHVDEAEVDRLDAIAVGRRWPPSGS